MPGSIYPSIPMSGSDLKTIVPAIEAMRQTLTLMILNGKSPNPNYTPSEAAQIFVTNAILAQSNLISSTGVFKSLPPQATTDAQAAALGVPIGGMYRNGNQLLVRVV